MRKKQKNLIELKRLWPALEALPGLAAVKAEWQFHLGDEIRFIDSLLQPQTQLATSYPRPSPSGYGLPLRVVDHSNGDFVGVCEETGETTSLRRDELIVYSLDRRAFAAAVASALQLKPIQNPPGQVTMPFPLGQVESATGIRFQVAFASPRNSADLHGFATRWISEHSTPFVLVTPTRRFWTTATEQTLRNNQCDLLSLHDSIAADESGKWVGKPNALSQLSTFGVPRTADEPLSDRAQLVLVAMSELGACDSDHRHSTDDIAVKALGAGADGNSLKKVMIELKSLQMIESKTGSGGGCWLTEKGRARAEKLRGH